GLVVVHQRRRVLERDAVDRAVDHRVGAQRRPEAVEVVGRIAAMRADQVVERRHFAVDDVFAHEVGRHDDRGRRLAGLDRGAGLEVGVVVAAGVGGGDVDVGVPLVEARDQLLHLAGERALHGDRKEQLDVGRRRAGGADGGGGGGGGREGEHAASVEHRVSFHLIPEKTKLATKRRWKTRNSSSRGPATIAVPAATTPQAEPASAPEANEARPTVSTWLRGEDSTISGQRNSFQCAVTDTTAKAIRPGRASGTSTRQISETTPAPSSIAASS